MGVEPITIGVAHRSVAGTTCLAVSDRDLCCEPPWAPESTSDDSIVGRKGIEPSLRRSKNPLQSQRLLPTHLWLKVKSGAPRWFVVARKGIVSRGKRRRRVPRTVPPSGIEPEPLGLQPSAQTNYARVGCVRCAPCARWRAATCLGACHGTLIVIALRLSEIVARRAQGAPRALARSPSKRAHLSRSRSELLIRDLESQNLDCGVTPDTRPETSKGRLVSPRRPFSAE